MRFLGSNVTKIRWRPGLSAPDSAGGAYSAAPDLLAGSRGAAWRRVRERKEVGRREEGKEGKGVAGDR